MFNAIELMSQLTPMTELFTDTNIRREPESPIQSRFGDMLSQAKAEMKPKWAKEGKTVTQPGESRAKLRESEKDEEEQDNQNPAVIGLMGQNNVVFILEGDSKETSELQITETQGTADVPVIEGQKLPPAAGDGEENAEITETEDTKSETDAPDDKQVSTQADVPQTEMESQTQQTSETQQTRQEMSTEQGQQIQQGQQTGQETSAQQETQTRQEMNTEQGQQIQQGQQTEQTRQVTQTRSEPQSKQTTDETEPVADLKSLLAKENEVVPETETAVKTVSKTDNTSVTDDGAQTATQPQDGMETGQITGQEPQTETKNADNVITADKSAETAETVETVKPVTEEQEKTQSGGKSEETISASEPNVKPEPQTTPVYNEPVQDTQTIEAESGTAQPETQPDAPVNSEHAAVITETAEPGKDGAGEIKAGQKTDDIDAAADTESADTDDIAIGKKTARTPTTRTAERSDTERHENGLSDKSGPGPLENENDAQPVKAADNNRGPSVKGDKKTETSEQTQETAPQQTVDIKAESITSNRQLRETVKTMEQTPVARENVFEAMVERIETMKVADMPQMSIKLNPEHLGDVTLKIAMTADGLQVKINAGNKDVSSSINSQINTLIETLSEKGIEVAKVEVAYSGVDSNPFGEKGGQQQNRRSGSNRRTGGRNTDDRMVYAVSALEEMSGYLDMGVSSVEYRA